MSLKTIKVLIVKPGEAPYAAEIPSTLESLQCQVGGLIQALYLPDAAIICNDEGIVDMFGLQLYSFENYLTELLGQNEWEPIEWPDNTEFLRLDPPFSGGYWQQVPEKSPRVSLARYGEPNKLFVFYRYYDGGYQQKAIPEWRIKDWFSNGNANYGEYRRIAIALLKQYGTLPEIKARAVENLVEIEIGYRFIV